MTHKNSGTTIGSFSRRQVLKWTGAIALVGHAVVESGLAHAFRSANTRPKYAGSQRDSDLLVDLEQRTSITLPPFDDASGTVHVVGNGQKTTISWRSS